MSKTEEATAASAVKHAETKLTSKERKAQKKQARLDASNKSNVVKKITKEKDLKYIYPADISTLPARKKFRSGVRRKVESLEKQYKQVKAGKVEGTTLPAFIKESNAYLKSVHEQPVLFSAE
jgi:hypothetical protein